MDSMATSSMSTGASQHHAARPITLTSSVSCPRPQVPKMKVLWNASAVDCPEGVTSSSTKVQAPAAKLCSSPLRKLSTRTPRHWFSPCPLNPDRSPGTEGHKKYPDGESKPQSWAALISTAFTSAVHRITPPVLTPTGQWPSPTPFFLSSSSRGSPLSGWLG